MTRRELFKLVFAAPFISRFNKMDGARTFDLACYPINLASVYDSLISSQEKLNRLNSSILDILERR